MRSEITKIQRFKIMIKLHKTPTYILCLLVSVWVMASCSTSGSKTQDAFSANKSEIEALKDTLLAITQQYPGEIGIALLTDRGDTVVINNEDKYPLMSVFKLHQAISLCRHFEQTGASPDTVVTIARASLNPDTWSPMLKDIHDDPIVIPVRDLMLYALQQSDNNASNYMFENFQSVGDVDSFIATLIPRESFRLAVTEAEMWSDHALSTSNHSSPLSAALLIDRLFTDSIISRQNRDFICSALSTCKTGTDRIVAPLAGIDSVTVAHKTGSGFRDEQGRLMAHNDVAYISLPEGRHYTLAVLVKDFDGSEEQASQAIARISGTVWSALRPYYSTE